MDRALREEVRRGAECKLTAKEEALLVAIACANKKEGRDRWRLERMADAMVELKEQERL